MFAYVWCSCVNDDYTAGDCIIVAASLEEAYALFDLRLTLPRSKVHEADTRMVGDLLNLGDEGWGRPFHPSLRAPDFSIPLTSGLVYFGPGGG